LARSGAILVRVKNPTVNKITDILRANIVMRIISLEFRKY
jgi:hypothetical protein